MITAILLAAGESARMGHRPHPQPLSLRERGDRQVEVTP
jgi:CTP:molybdopterin cytidylyltransferase MocA